MGTTAENIQASLLNFCKRFADAMNTQLSLNLTPVDLEAYAAESELPQQDLVGTTNVSIEVDEHFLIVECLIGVSTYLDEQNFRLRKLSGLLLEELKPLRNLPYLDAATGERLNFMAVLNGTKMMPVSGADRAVRFFMVRLKCAETLDLNSPSGI